ncbi:hypothetical protein A4X09_0g1065 [Tilletia walkeri]|uniref:Peroxin/Ferlin domain-containing protein n=1 Tax=Tilletia walkeri TaxID=117179 RepID=A0A8X7T709_9BASI|nr:hypothetical protein A4X09_0g1065 [Tilletia walkeri]
MSLTRKAGGSLPAKSQSSSPLSTADFIHRLPPAILRILVSFAPLIKTTHAFLLLATWSTPYPHHSLLLVVGYALAIIVGYPVLRYAPQLLILAYLGYAWIATLRPWAGSSSSSLGPIRETNGAKLNALVSQLDDIADFVSALHRELLAPALGLLSWSENPTRTKRLVIFLLTTYPLYLACYFPWSSLGLPTVQLDMFLPWETLGSAQSHAQVRTLDFLRSGSAKVLAKAPAGLEQQVLKLSSHPHISKAKVVFDAHVQPRLVQLYHLLARASHSLAVRYVPHKLSFQIMPPFPLGSLSVRSTVLTLGLIALTWCAPWAALIRSVLWRSAFVRRVVLGLVRLLSGETGPLAAFGRGHESTLDPSTGESVYVSSLIPDLGAVSSSGKGKKDKDAKAVKHEDVVYEFSVFENQRWWMGLDWTSALLPQERPSWSDEHHNAVSPPSSFSLPPAKVTLTPQDAVSGQDAAGEESAALTATKYTKRTVTWKWLDPEWTVIGAGYVGSIGYLPAGTAQAPIGLSTRSPLLGNGEAGSVPSTPTSGAPATDAAGPTGRNPLDVDEEGWSYGDNLWDKMSGKSGRGRYTRRRRWVRRAVLEIKVERDVNKAE